MGTPRERAESTRTPMWQRMLEVHGVTGLHGPGRNGSAGVNGDGQERHPWQRLGPELERRLVLAAAGGA